MQAKEGSLQSKGTKTVDFGVSTLLLNSDGKITNC